jgi:glucosyl-dolichyl phosphate glucuronosyltransferase
MHVSVILCTFNRCDCLGPVLDDLAAQVMPAGTEWEVLVVNNHSTDSTGEVVARAIEQHPGRFRYVVENQQGKSFALNRGIAETESEILAFVDDDVRVEPNWLAELTAPLAGGEWAGVGGRVIPLWSCPQPKWLVMTGPNSPSSVLVSYEQGEEPHETIRPPAGANMAFRRDVFVKLGGFRTDLGPAPKSRILGEDSEISYRVMNSGGRLLYQPAAIVHHPVTPGRLKKEYFLNWYFSCGRKCVRIEGIPPAARCLGRVPLYQIRVLLQNALGWMFTWRGPDRFNRKLRTWQAAGAIAETRTNHAIERH